MRYEKMLNVIDSHTVGEQTRVIVGGFPHVPGKTMIEKSEYASKKFGYIRDILALEPRGKKGIVAALTEPVTDDGHFGYIWVSPNVKGAKLFCGHGTIGVITTIVEMGLVDPKEPVTEVRLDFPLGRVTGYAHIKDGILESATAQLSWGAFLHKTFTVDLPKIGKIPVDLGFGGRYSAFLRSEDIGVKVRLENLPRLQQVAEAMYPAVMKKVEETGMEHPEWSGITWNGHTIIEDDPTMPNATHKNATLGPPRRYFDKSPCGSGTCGNMGILYSKGKLKLNEPFVNENLMGTATFTGRLTSKVKVGDFDAATPEYSGSAYITAISTVLVDPTDPFKHGFQDLKDPERAKLFQYAW